MNLKVETITTLDRKGSEVVIIIAVWRGRVVEVDSYRGSDMSQLETITLGAH